MARYRVLSLAALLLLALSAASLYALESARRTELRGAAPGYPQPIRGAESLRLGVNVALEQYDDAALDARLADLAERGVRYVRQEFRWTDIEPKPGQYDWSASDRIVSATLRHGMQVVAVLTTTPEWARGPSGSDEFPATATQPPQCRRRLRGFCSGVCRTIRREGRRTTDGGRRQSVVRRPSSVVDPRLPDLGRAESLRRLGQRLDQSGAVPEDAPRGGRRHQTREPERPGPAGRAGSHRRAEQCEPRAHSSTCAGCTSWAAKTPSTWRRPSRMVSTRRRTTAASTQTCLTSRTSS